MLLAMVRVGAMVRVRDRVTVMLLVMPRSHAGWKRGRLVGLPPSPRGAARRGSSLVRGRVRVRARAGAGARGRGRGSGRGRVRRRVRVRARAKVRVPLSASMTFHCSDADSSPTRPMPHPPAEEVGAHPHLEPAEAGAGCELLAQNLD